VSKKIIYKGVVYKSLYEFHNANKDTCQVGYATFLKNIRNGLPIEEAIKKNKKSLDSNTEEYYKEYITKNQFKKNTEIANHLDLSRERVRQLRIRYNISKVRSPDRKIINLILQKIKDGEATLNSPLPHKLFKDLDIGITTFKKWVEDDQNLKDEIYKLWEKSIEIKTNYTEKKCSDCKTIKPLDEFYIDKKARTIDGKARRCKQCTKDVVQHYYIKRNIEKPTVKYKVCKMCKKNKEFFEFYRSTKSNTGLQSVCITCHDKQTVLSNV
jgi:hypothetical protein